jgi:hypothetical protein
MELLSSEIRKNGFIYKLNKRGEKSMIYEQFDPELDMTIGWEVFKIKIDKPKIVFGVHMPEREIFPGNEDFGKWAWACSRYHLAEKRFNDLEEGILSTEEDNEE